MTASDWSYSIFAGLNGVTVYNMLAYEDSPSARLTSEDAQHGWEKRLPGRTELETDM